MNLTGRPVYQKGQKKRRRTSSDEKMDEEFRKWVRKQPCCVCNDFREFVNGVGRSQAAHVRLGGRGAIADKPLFSAVPLCHEDHGLQHNASHEVFGNKIFWLRMADLYFRRWRQISGRIIPPSNTP